MTMAHASMTCLSHVHLSDTAHHFCCLRRHCCFCRRRLRCCCCHRYCRHRPALHSTYWHHDCATIYTTTGTDTTPAVPSARAYAAHHRPPSTHVYATDTT